MGKTTFMINFFRRYSRKRRTHYAVRLVPLGYDRADAAIDEIEEKESTVLLLDAFDEDALAVIDYAERLQEAIVERCPHLVVRPMLLTYIDSLMAGRSADSPRERTGTWFRPSAESPDSSCTVTLLGAAC